MIRALDAVRAIAFLMVFFFHERVFDFGWSGVQFFFVLSGFLITRILIATTHLPFKDYLKVFYGRRVLRIFPIYYLYLGVVAIVVHYLITARHLRYTDLLEFRQHAVYALSYLYNFFNVTVLFDNNEFLTHFWSLAVEEQFYLVWPFLIFFMMRKNINKWFLITVIAAGPVLRMMTFVFFNHSTNPWLTDNSLMAVYVLPFSHLDAFATGGLLSQIKIKGAPRLLLAAAAIALVAGYGSYLLEGYPIHSLSSLGYPHYLPMGYYKFLWGYTLLNIVFGLWIYCVASEPFMQKWFENKTMVYLGKISYGLYIFHLPIIYTTKGLIKAYSLTVPLPLKMIIDLLLVIAVAGLSYRYFERFFLGLKDRLFAKKASAKKPGMA